jgi:hypothetical protein
MVNSHHQMETSQGKGGRMTPESKPHFTTRTDKTGRKVKIYKGDRYAEGKNGRGIRVGVGQTTKEDRHGQIYAIPIGGKAHEHTDGTITPLRYKQQAKQRKGTECEEVPVYGAKAKIQDRENLERLCEEVIRPRPNQTPDD